MTTNDLISWLKDQWERFNRLFAVSEPEPEPTPPVPEKPLEEVKAPIKRPKRKPRKKKKE